MRHLGLRPGTPGLPLLAAALLLAAAVPASAQLLFDGNLVYNNNASGTLAGQFTGTAGAGAPACAAGTTMANLATTYYLSNIYADPLLPNAPYAGNVRPDFRPGLGSPAFGTARTLPADGFFKQVCYKGAFDGTNDWTEGWTYWDSAGTTRQDLHLTGMPNPRPLATYDNVSLYGKQYFGPDSNYLVRGQLRIKSQASLTVAPGVVVFEENATLGTIIVERGGQIWAVASACDPIIITSDDALLGNPFARGHCGGVVINGYAQTNLVNSCGAADSAATEGGSVGYYGGGNDLDCSGALRYVRVEYSGREITPNNELNSFTFAGVGRNTRMDYCQAHRGADDGFEWFGGSMDCTHLVATDGTDDGYDTQMGTRNRAQFVVIRVSPEYAPSGTQNGDKGIEADNNEFDHNASQCAGYSNIKAANFTIIGDKRTGAAYPGSVSGANWRRGTSYSIYNSVVFNFKSSAVKVDDDATWQHHCLGTPAVPGQYCPGALSVQPITGGNVFVANSAPNPFRNSVAINFTLPQATPVEVHVYSADGRLVKTLENGSELAAGPHTLTWELDHSTPSGMYFYKVLAGNQSSTGKLVRIN